MMMMDASAAVAAAVLYTPTANRAALIATEPSADGYYEVTDSSNVVNEIRHLKSNGPMSMKLMALSLCQGPLQKHGKMSL